MQGVEILDARQCLCGSGLPHDAFTPPLTVSELQWLKGIAVENVPAKCIALMVFLGCLRGTLTSLTEKKSAPDWGTLLL